MYDNWFYHPPSVYTIGDLFITTILLLAVVLLWRRNVSPDANLRRAVERVAHRMDELELLSQRRESSHEEFRASMIDINERLLNERVRSNDTEQKLLARVEYVVQALDSRPCIANQKVNGDESCPDGHDIERKR